jgi:hypothetical protein
MPEDAMPPRPSSPAFGASKIHTSRRNRRVQRLSLKIKEKIGTRKIFENSCINTVRNKKINNLKPEANYTKNQKPIPH